MAEFTDPMWDGRDETPTQYQARMARDGKDAPVWNGPYFKDAGDNRKAANLPKVSAATVSAADLRTKVFEPLAYIVPNYIAEGCTLLAGRPKLGKSWMMLEISIGVAVGDYCLGGLMCESGDVLYLALEDNQRRLQSRMTKLIGAFAKEWPARLHFATEWPRADAGGLKLIRDWIAKHERPRLIVVDVLAAFRPQQRGDKQTQYEADYEAIQALQQIASETRVAIVVVHHLRKSTAESDPFEKVSGTFGLSGGADAALILDRDSNGTTLYGRGRDIEEIESAVEFHKESCRWRVLGSASEIRRTDERKAVLAALMDGGEMSPRDIASETGQSHDGTRQLLARMMKAGEITKLKRGKYALNPHHDGHNVTTSQRDTSTTDDCDSVMVVMGGTELRGSMKQDSAARTRRYRDRIRRGVQVVIVEMPINLVPVLIRAGVLENRENISGRELGNALLDYVRTHGKENP